MSSYSVMSRRNRRKVRRKRKRWPNARARIWPRSQSCVRRSISKTSAYKVWKQSARDSEPRSNGRTNGCSWLECYSAVADEREKWEAREERIVRQLQRLEADELSTAHAAPGEYRGVVTSVIMNGECGSRHENRKRSTETSRRVTVQSPTPRDSMTESPGCATTLSFNEIVSPKPMERISTQSSSVATLELVGGVPASPFGGVSTVVSTEAYMGVAGGASTGASTRPSAEAPTPLEL